MRFLFHIIFYKPLFNALLFLTSIVPNHDLGLAIILLTVIVRLLLVPLTHRATKSQIALKRLEPELRKIKKEISGEAERGKRMMELYRQHGVNPFSGFLMLLIQFPILIALYLVFQRGISFSPADVYSFVHPPEVIRTMFLGFWDMTRPNVLFAFVAGVTQFFQARLTNKMTAPQTQLGEKQDSFANDFSRLLAKQMTYMLPVLIFLFSLKLPAAVALYWTTITFFAIVHDAWIMKKAKTS